MWSTYYIFPNKSPVHPYLEMKVRNSHTPTVRWRFISSLTLPIPPLVVKKRLKLTMKSTCKYLLRSQTQELLHYSWDWRVRFIKSWHSLCSRPFYDRRMGQEIDGEVMGEQFKGYIFRITGGNDKQGFQMKQGILCNNRTRILFRDRKCYISSPLLGVCVNLPINIK